MRVLCISDEFPWPATTGYRLRLHHVVRGLAAMSRVDLLVVADDGYTPPVPTDAVVEQVRVLHLAPARRSMAGYLRWARGVGPRTITARPWGAVQRMLPALVAELAPDLVWWSHADVYAETHTEVRLPSIVDLDNLEDRKLRDRRAARRRDLADDGRRVPPSVMVKDLLDRVDEARWRRVQREALATAAATVVCSELDRRRIGASAVSVVPNGYSGPVRPFHRTPEPATFTMIGLFTYEPNRDAAEFLVRRVLPILLDRCPNAQVRLVGAHEGALDALAGPHVTVTGRVPDVAPELARATAVVVPLRFGGGTRLKVLEAFAYGVPVVSTNLGAEGLDVSDGRELLLGDDASAFATQCLVVLHDPTAAAARAVAAQRLWEKRFSGTQMERTVTDLARATAAATAPHARR